MGTARAPIAAAMGACGQGWYLLEGVLRELGVWAGVGVWYKQLDLDNPASTDWEARGSAVEQKPTHRHGSLTARKVSIRTPLTDVETFEKETATFHLELSHPGVTGVWTRDGIRVKPSSTCRISATGCGHSLTLERLALEDSGTVTFTADTLRCSAHLRVRGMVPGAGWRWVALALSDLLLFCTGRHRG